MRAQRLAIRLTHALGLPDDVMLGLPRLHLLGNRELTIENHRGVRSISPDMISVQTQSGTMMIRGEELILRCIGQDDLTIFGAIASLTFQDEEMP